MNIDKIKEMILNNKKVYFKGPDNGVNIPEIQEIDLLDFAAYCILANFNNGMFFKTKEDLEYSSIKRIDTLHLPNFEQFKNDKPSSYDETYHIDFKSADGKKCVLEKCDLIDEDLSMVIVKRINKYNDVEYLLKEELNDIGYRHACELCKKLFLGE